MKPESTKMIRDMSRAAKDIDNGTTENIKDIYGHHKNCQPQSRLAEKLIFFHCLLDGERFILFSAAAPCFTCTVRTRSR